MRDPVRTHTAGPPTAWLVAWAAVGVSCGGPPAATGAAPLDDTGGCAPSYTALECTNLRACQAFWAYVADLCDEPVDPDCGIIPACDLTSWYDCLTDDVTCGPNGAEGGEACISAMPDCRR